jgi:tetratricopeptide (TPR) repeat protein
MNLSKGAERQSGHPKHRRSGRLQIPTVLTLTVFILTLLGFSGCAGLKGKYYFDKGAYTRAASQFKQALQDRPRDATMNFYMGRSLLALDRPVKALPHLKAAAASYPRKAAYYFWLGVAYWANMDFDQERDSYLAALSIDPAHVQSHVYLGHNLMDRNAWSQALAQYDLALKTKPDLAEALYNRGLALQRLGRRQDEKAAWKAYLKIYHGSGSWAARAVEHLNATGDFSYRMWRMGAMKLSIPSIGFKPGTSELTPAGVDAVSHIRRVLAGHKALDLHVIAYVEKNSQLAQTRARKVKQSILKNVSAINPARIKVSWFNIPEEISIEGKNVNLSDSVKLIAIQRRK